MNDVSRYTLGFIAGFLLEPAVYPGCTASCYTLQTAPARTSAPVRAPAVNTIGTSQRIILVHNRERYLLRLGHRPDPHQMVARLRRRGRTGSRHRARRHRRDYESPAFERGAEI